MQLYMQVQPASLVGFFFPLDSMLKHGFSLGKALELVGISMGRGESCFTKEKKINSLSEHVERESLKERLSVQTLTT